LASAPRASISSYVFGTFQPFFSKSEAEYQSAYTVRA
jgi:hypothetical protein